MLHEYLQNALGVEGFSESLIAGIILGAVLCVLFTIVACIAGTFSKRAFEWVVATTTVFIFSIAMLEDYGWNWDGYFMYLRLMIGVVIIFALPYYGSVWLNKRKETLRKVNN